MTRAPLPTRFWRLYASSATSNLADGIGRTALPLIGASFTRNPLLISGLVTFAFLPWLFFALPSGALVDRVDRRHAMAAANVVRAAATGVLAVLVALGDAGIVTVYAAAFALGLAETVYDSASRAILPQLLDRSALDRGNGLLTIEETLGQTFLGAPVGSALFSLAVAVPLVVNAGGFVATAVLLLALRGNFRASRDGEQSIRHDIADGVRWLTAHRFLRELTVLSATTAFFGAIVNGVLVLWVLETLRLPSADFGFVVLAAGVGGLLGGLLTPRLSVAVGRGRMLMAAGLLEGVATVGMGLVRNGFLGAALFAVSAFGVMIWNVLTMSLRQALIPHAMFGRVQGAYRTLVWGAIPLGALAGGAVAHASSVPTALVVAGVGMTSTGIWLVSLVIRHRAVVDHVDDGDDPAGVDIAVSPAGAT